VKIVQSARHDSEAHKAKEWEMVIRTFAGGRDGARAIEWARRELEKSRATPAHSVLSDILAKAYAHLMRGDTITADLEWRMK
jgi:hypothetical protein